MFFVAEVVVVAVFVVVVLVAEFVAVDAVVVFVAVDAVLVDVVVEEDDVVVVFVADGVVDVAYPASSRSWRISTSPPEKMMHILQFLPDYCQKLFHVFHYNAC